jgi:hypothetical protein
MHRYRFVGLLEQQRFSQPDGSSSRLGGFIAIPLPVIAGMLGPVPCWQSQLYQWAYTLAQLTLRSRRRWLDCSPSWN